MAIDDPALQVFNQRHCVGHCLKVNINRNGVSSHKKTGTWDVKTTNQEQPKIVWMHDAVKFWCRFTKGEKLKPHSTFVSVINCIEYHVFGLMEDNIHLFQLNFDFKIITSSVAK